MKAMIFAAGIGKRLGDITSARPKALVTIKNKSLLRISVEKLTSHGFNDIIVNIHHFAEMVEREINDLKREGFRISISDERDLLLETGGGLQKARWFFGTEPFLRYNADIITDLNLESLLGSHTLNDCLATLAVAERNDSRAFLTDKDGIICGWLNRQSGEKIIAREADGVLTELGFSGIHIVNPEIFRYMEEGVYSMTSLYLRLAQKHRICTFRHDNDFWADIGTPEQLAIVKNKFGDTR
jgi:NDP-sugar pyrophosphorylase family protein